MATTRVNLDVTQYVRVTSDPLKPSSLLLQSHRDTVRVVFSDVKPAKSNTVYHELGGEHPPLNVPMTEQAVWALAMTDKSALTVTEQRVPIEISNRDVIGASVFLQDQTTDPVDAKLNEGLFESTIAVLTVIDTRTVTLAPGHGAVIGNQIAVVDPLSPTIFFLGVVLGVAGDVLTLDSLVNRVYAIGSIVRIANTSLIVDGSVTPRVFSVRPIPGLVGDITRLIVSIEDDGTMDFSKFGSIAPLVNGCMLRVKRPSGEFVNLFNWKTNGDFILRSFDHSFETKTGGGSHSFVSRSTWGGQSKRGVVLRLDGGTGEEVQIVVQDDLTGLDKFEAVVQGHLIQE